jgi:hypothetical protein
MPDGYYSIRDRHHYPIALGGIDVYHPKTSRPSGEGAAV